MIWMCSCWRYHFSEFLDHFCHYMQDYLVEVDCLELSCSGFGSPKKRTWNISSLTFNEGKKREVVDIKELWLNKRFFFEFYETKKLEEMIQFDEHFCFKWFFAPLRRNPVNITLTFSDGVFHWILLCIIDTVKLFSGQDAVLGQSHLRNARI